MNNFFQRASIGSLSVTRINVKKALTIVGRFLWTFYTFRAVGLHLLYLLGFLPNTWIIALVVLIGSQFFLFVYPCYRKIYVMNSKVWLFETILHVYPAVFLPREISQGSLFVLIMSLILYVLGHGGVMNVYRFYRYKYETECKLRGE